MAHRLVQNAVNVERREIDEMVPRQDWSAPLVSSFLSMTNLVRSAKPGSHWTENDLAAYNVEM